MADYEREVTPAIETTPPPAPLHSNPVPFSFRAEKTMLKQSGSRLIVVNYFDRRMSVWLMCIFSLMFPLTWLPPFHYWMSLFNHATWRTILSAVLATNRQLDVIEVLILSFVAISYRLLVVGGLNGVVLDLRNGTAKAAGRTRLLTDVEAVRVVATRFEGKPDPSGRIWRVELLWSKTPDTSLLGYFPNEADADKIAEAVAEFAGVPVRHQPQRKIVYNRAV